MLQEKKGINTSENELARVLKELKREGRLKLESPTQGSRTFFTFAFAPEINSDFWSIIASLIILVMAISFPDVNVLTPLRWVLGTFAILLFPGYSMQMGLFPRREDLLLWKRMVLSVGLSIAVTGFYATILDATVQGIVFGSVLIVFSLHTLIFAWIGLLRRFEAQRSRS